MGFVERLHYSPSHSTESKKIKNYETGKQLTANVGDPMISRGDIAYEIESGDRFVALQSLGDCIDEGDTRTVLYQDVNDGSLYVPYCNRDTAIRIDEGGELLNKHAYYWNIGGWQNNLLVPIEARVGDKLFKSIDDKKNVKSGSHKMEIIYLGRDGENLKATYREFTNNMARPAFTQELTYNLEESHYLRYQNFKIKVIDANNERIEYVVSED